MEKTSKPLTREAAPARKAAWVAPSVDEMPRLTELTLQTGGGGIPGGDVIGSAGSTVF